MKIDLAFAEELLAKAKQAGADEAEVYVASSKNLSVEIKDQKIDSLTSSISFGYSLRLIKGGRLGFSYSTVPEEAAKVVRKALDGSCSVDRDEFLGLPEASDGTNVDIFDPEVKAISQDDAVRRVKLLEQSVYNEDSRIKRTRKASGSFSVSETAILNSKSVKVHYAATSCSAQVMAVAEEAGESRMGWEHESSRFLGDVSFERVGRAATQSAVRLLGARKIEGCRASVLLDHSVTVDFLELLAASFSADAVLKGKSLLLGRLGQRIMSTRITLADNGILPGKLGSRPVDAEGVPTAEKVLVEKGVLKKYLYNTYTARKDHTVSTGNAVRGGYAGIPGVGVTNLYMKPASDSLLMSRKELCGCIDKGLHVYEAMGVHTANPISGDFSIGVSGIWIEKGEAVFPVKEAVISGNMLDFFDKIDAVGDDLRFYGNIGAPSLMVSAVDISA